LDENDDSLLEELEELEGRLKYETFKPQRIKSKFREDRYHAKKLKEIMMRQNKELGRLSTT